MAAVESVRWRAFGGVHSRSATSTGLSGSPVTFTATGTAGTAATIAANSATSQSATAGTAVSTPPSVIVKDANRSEERRVGKAWGVAGGNGASSGGRQTTHGRRSDYLRQGDGGGGERAVAGVRGCALPICHLDRLERQPRDVHGDGDGGHGGDDCGEQCDEPVGHGGHGGQYAAVGDREGREQIGRASCREGVGRGGRERGEQRREADNAREAVRLLTSGGWRRWRACGGGRSGVCTPDLPPRPA